MKEPQNLMHMNRMFYPICLCFAITAQIKAQCFSSIQGPTQAVSNCSGPQFSVLSSGSGPYQYLWTSPTLNISSSTAAIPYVSASTPGWHTLSVLVVDSSNCTSVATDSIQFFPPVTTFTQTYCTLPDSVCILDCPMMVQSWSYTDNQNNTINLPLNDCVGIVGPGSYKVIGVYNMNCTALHTYLVSQDCGSGSGCTANIQAPSQAVSNCTGPQVTATASGPGPYQYFWTSPTLNIMSPNSAVTTISTNSPGWHIINLIVVDANNCSASATDSIQFFPPVATFTQTYCTLPDSVCILDCPMIVQGWTYTGNQNNTINLPLNDCVGIVGPGSYKVMGIYNMNCTAQHTYLVTEDCGGMGISESFEPDFTVFPNPFSEKISLRQHIPVFGTWKLFDSCGRLLFEGQIKGEQEEINTTEVSSGLYILQAFYGERISSYRLIK